MMVMLIEGQCPIDYVGNTPRRPDAPFPVAVFPESGDNLASSVPAPPARNHGRYGVHIANCHRQAAE